MKIFISYSTKNRHQAVRLASTIQELGVDVWYDEWEILVGHNLADQIYNGIKASNYFFVILTKDSVKSKWVKEELDLAKVEEIENGGTLVVPLLFEDCPIPFGLRAKVYADFRESFDHGFTQISKIINQSDEKYSSGKNVEFDYEIPIPYLLIANQILTNYPIRTFEYLDNPEEIQDAIGILDKILFDLRDLAKYVSVDRRCYTWIDELVSLRENLAGSEDWIKQKEEMFNMWFKGRVLLWGGLSQKLPIYARIALDLSRVLGEFPDRERWLDYLTPVIAELDFSESFIEHISSLDSPDTKRIINALTFEMGSLHDYKKIRKAYLKKKLSQGIWAGFYIFFSIIFLSNDLDTSLGKFIYTMSLSAEYVLAELDAIDNCIFICDFLNIAHNLNIEDGEFGRKLTEVYDNLLELGHEKASISMVGKVFLFGLLIGQIMLEGDDKTKVLVLVQEIESLSRKLDLEQNTIVHLRSWLDDAYYVGWEDTDVIGFVTSIADSFRT